MKPMGYRLSLCLAAGALLVGVSSGNAQTIPADGQPDLLIGAGPGGGLVRLLNGADGSELAAGYPWGAGLTTGVRVAAGDVTGDGIPDLMVATGPGDGRVSVFDGTNAGLIASFAPFGTDFRGGIHLATGDMDGDGRIDLLVGGGPGSGRIRIYSGATHQQIATDFPFGPAYTGGITLAAGDINGDGRLDVIAGQESGGLVRVFDGFSASVLASGAPYGTGFAGGIHVAAGDVDGDGRAEIITGARTGSSLVLVINALTQQLMASFAPFGGVNGVTVAAGDLDGDGVADLVVGAGPGGAPRIRVFRGPDGLELLSGLVLDAGFTGGVFVATTATTAGLRFTSSNAATFEAGTAGTFAVTTTGQPGAILTAAGTLPAGVTFADNGDGTATLSGTPAAGTGGTYPLTFTAAGTSATAVQAFILTVTEAPAITSAATVTFPLGVPGTFTITTTGFPSATLTISGALPSGITFTDNGDGTATIGGTPAPGSGGIHGLVITASNGIGADAVQAFTLTVDSSPAFTSAPAAVFSAGTPGSFPVTTTGAPPVITIALGGVPLPAGLAFDDNGDGTALFSGTPGPGTGGTYALTLTASNGVHAPAVQAFTLTVTEAPTLTSAAATTFSVNTPGTFTVTTTGHPAPAITAAGTWPPGLIFTDNGNGTATLQGSAAPGSGGPHVLELTAANGASPDAVQTFTLTVTEAPAVTSAGTAVFTINVPGVFTVTTSGSPTPAIALSGVLPAGVTFIDNGNGTGTLSGTAAAGASYPLTITAANGTLPDAVQSFTLAVNQAPAITSANTASFVVGTPDSFTVTATGFPPPTLSQAGALPAGITFTPGTGVLGGTATEAGTFAAIEFTAANGVGPDAVQGFTLQATCPVMTITPANLPDGLYQTAYGPVTLMHGGSTGSSFTWSATGLPSGLALNSTTGVLSGTPVTTVLAAPVSITMTDNFGCEATLAAALTIRPLADNESYLNGVGHTAFVVGAAQPATPHVFVNDTVLAGDLGPGTLAASLATGPANGSVALAANGAFVYTPNVNFAGPTDSFTYTLTDGNGVTNTGTVTIAIANIVWYVNSAAGAGGDGRSHSPFNSLASAALPSGSTHVIYVHTGGATTPGDIALDPAQTLHGQGAVFTLGALTIPAGVRPTLTGTITLAGNTVVRAVNLAPAAAGLTANGVTLPVTIDQVNVTGGTNALSLANVSGAVTITNAVFSNTSGAEVLISQGNGTVSIGAAISNTTGRSVDIQGRNGGAVIFSGPIVDTGSGIFLNANAGSAVSFTGGLSLTTGINPAFTATGGGTVSATQNNTTIVNTIATTTGTALQVTGTTIGAAGLTFRSIGATGAASGIVLSNTGAAGGLTVTGNGGSCTAPGTCTGGAIQNTSADALALTSTSAVSLTRLFIGGSLNHGINATAVNGLTLSNAVVQNSGNGDNEYGLNMVNVSGTVTIDATTFNGAADNLVQLENLNTNATLNVVNNSQFIYPASISPFANSAILIMPGGTAAITATIQNTTFTNVVNAATQIGANQLNSSGTQSLTFSGNTINVGMAGRASGVVVSGQELTTTNLTITNNTFTGAGGNGVISIDTNDLSTVRGTVTGNQITSPPGIGMFVAVDEGAIADVLIDNNTITGAGGDGIQAVNFGGIGVSTMQLAITNNIVNGHSSNTAVNFVGGISFTGFEDVSCLVLRGNTVTGTPTGPTHCGGAACVDYYIEEVGGTVRLEEVPDTPATTANASYVTSINDPGLVTIFGVIDLTNGAVCNAALMAAAGQAPSCGEASPPETQDLVQALAAATRRMNAAAGLGRGHGSGTGVPQPVPYLTRLAAGQLGRVAGTQLVLDRDAAGWGWFVDPTPDEDEEYEPAPAGQGGLRARPGGPAEGKMDLLTVLMHEMGHARGEVDLDPGAHGDDVMGAALEAGVRRRPRPRQ